MTESAKTSSPNADFEDCNTRRLDGPGTLQCSQKEAARLIRGRRDRAAYEISKRKDGARDLSIVHISAANFVHWCKQL